MLKYEASYFEISSCFLTEQVTEYGVMNDLRSLLLNQNLKYSKQVIMSAFPWSLKLVGDELWSCQEDGISVYGPDFLLVRSIHLRWTRSAALLPDGNVVIAGLSGLQKVSKAGIFYIYNYCT